MVSKAEDFRLILLGKKITPVASAQEVPFFLDSSLKYNNHVRL